MTWLDTHAADPTFFRATLFEFNLPSVARWTAWDIPVVAKTFQWIPKPLKLTSLSCSAAQPGASGSIEIGNADGWATAAFASAVVGSRVTIWDAWLDPSLGTTVSQDETLVASGRLESWNTGQDVMNVSIGQFLPYAGVPFPRRPYALTCPWVFKGSQCGYAGATATCDRTRTACVALGKWANFGGFARLDPRG
jgi:phage-related protein